MSLLRSMLEALAFLALGYFAVLNAVYLVFTAIAWRGITRHRRERLYAAVDEVFASPLTPPITMLVPAYNEEAGIVESVRSLLALRYPEHEVVVVNDGSSDATLDRLVEAFDLVPVRRALRGAIPTAPVRAVYGSRRHHELWVIDKENGGKADALNAAVTQPTRHTSVRSTRTRSWRRMRSCAWSRRCWTTPTSWLRPAESSASPTAAASSTAA